MQECATGYCLGNSVSQMDCYDKNTSDQTCLCRFHQLFLFNIAHECYKNISFWICLMHTFVLIYTLLCISYSVIQDSVW